jgi:glycerate 2-kinase
MRILIAPDKFKGSLSAPEVCEAIRIGILHWNPSAILTALPLADGGEGTLEVLVKNSGAKLVDLPVTGPLFNSVNATYGLLDSSNTAYIEIARASGLQLLDVEKRNPLLTTTFGVGELIKDALEHGVRNFIMALGGSATNDAGMGMAAALGFEFYDKNGEALKATGENLATLYNIGMEKIDPRLRKARFLTLTDVSNSLYGPDGAAFVFAAQKGADDLAIEKLDDGLRNFARVAKKVFQRSVEFPGAGAAGGMGAGCRVFLNSEIMLGMDYISRISGIDALIQNSDLVITGEGRLDESSFYGKVAGEVIGKARSFKKTVVVICGVNTLAKHTWKERGIYNVISISNHSANSSLKNAFDLIVNKVSAGIEF